MDRVSRFTSAAESSTAVRFERLQVERNKKRSDLEAADGHVQLVPTCEEMCPEYERLERELHFDVHSFEALNYDSATSSTNYLIDHGRAVKKYHRPAAGNETPLPEDVRTPDSLLRVLQYLFHQILDNNKYSFSDRHSFIRDRTRSVRQDLTLQSCHDTRAVLMHEQIARFHIISGHVLCEADPAEFDAFQNTEQLRKVLQSLREMYDDLWLCGWAGEDEFRGYYILTHLQDPTIFKTALEFPDTIKQTKRVMFALEAAASFHHGDYVRYGRLILEGDYLQAALLHTHLTALRFRALETMSKAYPAGQSFFNITDIVRLLSFQSDMECHEFLTSHEVPVSPEGMVQVTAPSKPSEPVKPWRLEVIEQKRMSLSLSALVLQVPTTFASVPTVAPRVLPTRPPTGTIDPMSSKINTRNDLYTALIDFCVPLLLKQVTLDAYNQCVGQLRETIVDWKRQCTKTLFNGAFDSIISELTMEIVKTCTNIQLSSIRHRMALSVYERLESEAIDQSLPSLLSDVYADVYAQSRRKRVSITSWKSALTKRRVQRTVSDHHNTRVHLESLATDMLFNCKSPAKYTPQHIVDLDRCFTFPNAVVWLAVRRTGSCKFVAKHTRIITEPSMCPHIVLCDVESIDSVRQQLATLHTAYSPSICTVEEAATLKYDNLIPDLAEMSHQELSDRLRGHFKNCVCSKEYKQRLLEFVRHAMNFLLAQDPSLLLHPDYRPDTVYLPSLLRIEQQLSQMTAGLQSHSSRSTPVRSTPAKHTIRHVIMTSSTDNSPVRKLQRILEESRRSSSAFEGLLAETLQRQ